MQVGDRVEVWRGTVRDIRDDSLGRHSHALWCAGDIPIGEFGTVAPVYKNKLGRPTALDMGYGTYQILSQIVWDNPKYKVKDQETFWGFQGAGMAEIRVVKKKEGTW